MFSLLNPYVPGKKWPVSLELPEPEQETQVKEYGLGKVSACPHPNRKHYAKHMCSQCYHKRGREKLAWLCEHTDRMAYCKGRCERCYLHY
eukprot:CAMPEP_0204910350 /NCGR_PEP_ID=MMETSP1397-20131031/8898_1 /ASSEMBLY_ACC=CAM_ASM_000891 /TAXON_ID=49980 /ORGANISM="Climacostomum Climacostomum virens, Strain Stock W-24" /LENGTH=89 /DNA_ID=CAMNT_0052080483 /DNA_START=21 /DNA_END=287 /DNA_ORIENTATION=-